MFSNFKNAFVRKTQFNTTPPEAITNVLNAELPKGFKYIHVGGGMYALDAEGGLDIQSGRIIIPEEAKQFFCDENHIDTEKLKQYSYNTQKNIEIVPDEDGCLLVNGERFNSHDFLKAPLKNLKGEEFHFVMIPPPFPEPFPLTLSGEGYDLEVFVQRTAINSLDEVAFETVEEAPIRLRYTYNTVENKGTFNVSTKNGFCKCVEDVVKVNHIFNACISGNGSIAGLKLGKATEARLIPKEAVEFWDRMLVLERHLDVHFDPNEKLTRETIDKLYELYHCFVIKEPFRKYEKYTNVKGKGIAETVVNDLEAVGKEMFFEFEQEEIVCLLGVSLKYYVVVGIYGAVVKAVLLPEKDKYREFLIELEEAVGKKMYSSKMFFLSNEEVELFRQQDNHISDFSKAKELSYMM